MKFDERRSFQGRRHPIGKGSIILRGEVIGQEAYTRGEGRITSACILRVGVVLKVSLVDRYRAGLGRLGLDGVAYPRRSRDALPISRSHVRGRPIEWRRQFRWHPSHCDRQ